MPTVYTQHLDRGLLPSHLRAFCICPVPALHGPFARPLCKPASDPEDPLRGHYFQTAACDSVALLSGLPQNWAHATLEHVTVDRDSLLTGVFSGP